jgi:PAS domain S-box-containing protein
MKGAAEIAREAALRATVLDHMADAVLVVDAEGRIVLANPVAERFFGAPIERLVDMTAHGWQAWSTLARDGSPVPDEERPLARALTGRPTAAEYRVVRRDGSERWGWAVAQPLCDDDGALVGAVAVVRDTTERHAIEEALAASEERFRRQYKSNPVPLYTYRRIGDDYVLVDYNDAAADITRGAIAGLVGRRLVDLYGDYPEVLSDFLRCAAEGQPVRRELLYRFRSTGEERPLLVTYVPVPPDLMYVHTEDMTDRREAERQREAMASSEKMRALGQLAGGVAHDLNQSLAMVSGYAELARKALADDDPGEARRLLDVASQAAMDGGETVKRLLTFARTSADGEPGKPIDVGAVLHEVARLTAPRWRDAAQAEGRPIALRVDAAPALVVSGWAHELREAATNLVFNAVDALPRGGEIRLLARERGGHVVIEVSDDGVGMPPAVRARALEPFFTTKGERGTGLGLAMVFGIAQRHHGAVELESTPEAGTTVRLVLPAGAPTASPVCSVAGAPAGAAAPLRILVVDDEPRIGQMAALMLGRHGHAVEVATSGEEALELMERGAFDLVVSDLSMGDGLNGWGLAAEVARRWPSVRVALATGWGAAIDAEQARRRGVEAVLAKPFRTEELLRIATRVDASR